MAISTKLELRQTHNLVMTPQLQQAIKLLQLSNIELASFVEAELERNPLLEHADSDETGGAADERAVEPGTTASKEDGAGEAQGASGETASGEGEAEAGDGDDGEWIDLEAASGRTEDLAAEPP